MTAPAIRLDLARLRRAATLLRRLTGIRVEIDPAEFRPVHPPRCVKHAALVGQLADGLRPVLPPGRSLAQLAGVALDDRSASYVVPDLVVCPTEVLRSESSHLCPQGVDIIVEVVVRHAAPVPVERAVDRYAAAGVRALLVVDPRPVTAAGTGTWALHTEPVGGHYWATTRGTFGAGAPRSDTRTIALPRPFRGELSVATLPVYDYGPART
ncbi:hypothetical protein N566_27025 [Streptomycetaceae bacterium MP113-05]|nr:hypothetical protein N566_27025 [Streptomycetaceae bacterium MP113-05]